jgi:hypothetical protein
MKMNTADKELITMPLSAELLSSQAIDLRLTPEYQVFINCPFDKKYLVSLFEPMLFAIQACGFNARCALEASRETDRFKRIQYLVKDCSLSIHDLSRNKKDEDPRFNMPFELGVFIGCQIFGGDKHVEKTYLVLDREEYGYQKYISDINGQDPRIHNNKAKDMIKIIRNWLSDQLEIIHPNDPPAVQSGPQIYEAYIAFKKSKDVFCKDSRLDSKSLTFNEHRKLITTWWLKQNKMLEFLSIAKDLEPQEALDLLTKLDVELIATPESE